MIDTHTLERPTRRILRYSPLLLLSMPAAWFAYVLAFNPTDHIADPTGPCLWHRAFHIDGPGCGITRMTWYLLHGDIIDAARMHLAALLLIPAGAYAYLSWTGHWVFNRRLPMPQISKRLAIGCAITFLVYAIVLRNLPWQPFHWFYVPNLT